MDEAFYWAEQLDNGGSFADHGVKPTPGITAALNGLWRGRNKADNEKLQSAEEDARARAEQQRRQQQGNR